MLRTQRHENLPDRNSKRRINIPPSHRRSPPRAPPGRSAPPAAARPDPRWWPRGHGRDTAAPELPALGSAAAALQAPFSSCARRRVCFQI